MLVTLADLRAAKRGQEAKFPQGYKLQGASIPNASRFGATKQTSSNFPKLISRP